MARRLDLAPDKKLRGMARHRRVFDGAMDRVAGWYPAAEGRFCAVKLPVYDKAVSERHGTEAFRHHVVRRLVEVAGCVAQNRPSGAGYGRVAALIEWPDLWGSEICVFLDADYAEGFSPSFRAAQALSRYEWDGGWSESLAVERDLLSLAGAVVPSGFGVHGQRFCGCEDGQAFDRESWVVMEPCDARG